MYENKECNSDTAKCIRKLKAKGFGSPFSDPHVPIVIGFLILSDGFAAARLPIIILRGINIFRLPIILMADE